LAIRNLGHTHTHTNTHTHTHIHTHTHLYADVEHVYIQVAKQISHQETRGYSNTFFSRVPK